MDKSEKKIRKRLLRNRIKFLREQYKIVRWVRKKMGIMLLVIGLCISVGTGVVKKHVRPVISKIITLLF